MVKLRLQSVPEHAHLYYQFIFFYIDSQIDKILSFNSIATLLEGNTLICIKLAARTVISSANKRSSSFSLSAHSLPLCICVISVTVSSFLLVFHLKAACIRVAFVVTATVHSRSCGDNPALTVTGLVFLLKKKKTDSDKEFLFYSCISLGHVESCTLFF